MWETTFTYQGRENLGVYLCRRSKSVGGEEGINPHSSTPEEGCVSEKKKTA